MIEVECKLKIDNTDSIEVHLNALGFKYSGTVEETDTYYDNELGQIRGNDSALRIRNTINIESGITTSELNFKGPKYDKVSVTRPEFETLIADGAATKEILCQLGYSPVTPYVHKIRKTLSCENITACIDKVEGLGTYLELEIVVPEENKKDASLLKIESILNKLGYTMSDTTTTSYLSALQQL